MRRLIFVAAAALLCSELVFNASATAFSADAQSTMAKTATTEIARLCESAKANYAPNFDAQTSAAKANLLAKLRAYQEYASRSNSHEIKALAAVVDPAKMTKTAGESPLRFRQQVAKAEKLISAYARNAAANVEREKSLAVSMNYYLTVCARPVDGMNVDAESDPEFDSDVDVELEQEKRANFEYYCDVLRDASKDYFQGGGEESVEEIVEALGEILYYQPESPTALKLASYVRSFFADDNVRLEANERFLSALAARNATESFAVNEVIRGAQMRGSGVVQGKTRVDLKPNDQRAEMIMVFSGAVRTKTVGTSRRVDVHSDNAGGVWVGKPIYLNPSGKLSTSAAVSSAAVKSNILNINTDRLALFGGSIIRNKVRQELPFSEREGNERLRARVAGEFDKQVNEQIGALNQRIASLTSIPDSMVRGLSVHTSETTFHLSCSIGKTFQATAPTLRVDRADREKTEELAVATSEDRVAGNASRDRARLLQRNKTMETANCDAPDVVVRFHQSAPTNAANIALAGAVFGPGYDGLDNVLFRFPGVDPVDVKKFLAPYEPKEAKALDPDDHYKNVFVRFDEVRPFSTSFQGNKISTVLRISSCDVDGKEWGPIDVIMVYALKKEGERFHFVRENVDVMPGGYQDGDAVSARFHTFRRIFIKRLETTVLDEYVFSPIPLSELAAPESTGELVPTKIEADDGWFRIELRYDATACGE